MTMHLTVIPISGVNRDVYKRQVFGSVAVSDQVYAADVSVSGTVIGTDGKSTVSGANIVLRDKSDCTKEYLSLIHISL